MNIKFNGQLVNWIVLSLGALLHAEVVMTITAVSSAYLVAGAVLAGGSGDMFPISGELP